MKKLIILTVAVSSILACASIKEIDPSALSLNKSYPTAQDDNILFEKIALYLPKLLNNDGMTAGKMTQEALFGNYNRGKGKKIGVNYSSKELKTITATGMVKITYSFTPIDTYYELEVKVDKGSVTFIFTDMTNGAGKLTNQGQIDAFTKEIVPIIDNFMTSINR